MMNYNKIVFAIIIFIMIGCKNEKNKYYPNNLTVLLDEKTIKPKVINATLSNNIDNNIFLKNYSTKITTNNEGDAQLIWIFQNKKELKTKKEFRNTQNIGIWLLFDNPNKIKQVIVEIYSDTTNKWIRSTKNLCFNEKLSNKWNLYRWRAKDSNIDKLGVNVTKVKLIFQTTESTGISIGYLFAESQPKAKLLFVQDGGYSKGWISEDKVKGQKKSGIEECTKRKIPITWALNPNRITENTIGVIDLPHLIKMKENKNNNWSFHSFDKRVLKNYSEQEMKDDVRKSINWFKQHNFRLPHFRAAHMQNNAPKAYSTIGYMGLKALATSTNRTGGMETFPFTDRWDINRTAIHNLSYKKIDEKFNILKQNKCLLIAYTHKIVADSVKNNVDIKISAWNHFLHKIDTAVSEGWLELVSYKDLEDELKKYNIEDNDTSISIALLKELQYLSTKND